MRHKLKDGYNNSYKLSQIKGIKKAFKFDCFGESVFVYAMMFVVVCRRRNVALAK